jgi:hypothetical protein
MAQRRKAYELDKGALTLRLCAFAGKTLSLVAFTALLIYIPQVI